jgi:hypothetical protein
MTLVIGVIALGVAMLMSKGSGEDLFRTMVTLFGIATAPVAVPMLLGLLSKKVTSLSAMLGFLFGLGTGLALWKFVPGDQIAVAGYVWKMEIVLFMSTALVTLIVMVVTSAVRPMTENERERTIAFHKRLDTPIGELEEDRAAAAPGAAIFSPFRVVGISILAIGGMMLAVLPWVNGALAQRLDLFLGLLLLVIGGLMTWRSGNAE